MKKTILVVSMLAAAAGARAQACFETSVMSPSPLMGNHGEMFRTAEGGIYEVVGSYEYLYAYSPQVVICPSRGRMMVNGRTVGIMVVQAGAPRGRAPSPDKSSGDRPQRRAVPSGQVVVVKRVPGCDYFIADGPRGLYVLEWYGGHDPDEGEGIVGQLGTYGFKDVMYAGGQSGRLYVEDYALGQASALERLREKCL